MSEPADAHRRRIVALAGHTGDVATARAALEASDAQIVTLGLSAMQRLGALDATTLNRLLAHTDPTVRRRATELAAHHGDVSLTGPLEDEDDRVVEMAAWAAGERPYRRDEHDILRRIAGDHEDALCREAAVAALGAIGHVAGRPVVLAALDDIATVRRRAVVALAPFEGPEVEAALRRALDDRDWQVRQGAEDLLADD